MKRETGTILRLALRRFSRWAAQHRLGRALSISLLIATVAAGFVTYLTFAGVAPFAGGVNTVLLTLYVDLALGLLLGSVVAHRLARLWAQRMRGSAGAKLHVRLVVMFSAVAVTPTVIVAFFSALFFQFGIQSWFNQQVATAVRNSVLTAESYLSEHKNNIRSDALAMANDLNADAARLMQSPARFNQAVATQALLRNLTEAIVVDGSGNVLARSTYSFSLEFERFPMEAIELARSGDVAMLIGDKEDRVRAIVKLDRFFDAYMFVGRPVDPKVLSYIEQTRKAASQYEELRGARASFQVTFALIFAVVAMLLLLAAVWVGLLLANHLARPIAALIAAAERVRGGDLTTRVPEVGVGDEMGSLSRAFNRMASQLANQQHELIEANRQLDLRNRFTEAVLSGVSAGVIGLDQKGRINLPNKAASQLLHADLSREIGRDLGELAPEMATVVEDARRRPERVVETQIRLARAVGARTLLVRVAADQAEGEIKGFVVTFDDITELQSAQRTAAWADVARRIAHEIKNPLTPIQLSAERLKRKYLKEITSDPDTFKNCTDTIVRQVGDIGRMVDEFSAFARMPAPVMRGENLAELCHHAIELQRHARTDVDFVQRLPPGSLMLPCDARQVGQALTNLLQNALDAIDGRERRAGEELPRGRIELAVARNPKSFVVSVIDNGKGLPAEGRERLTEPYVTTRSKGTGLGLAIVKKIMEDHGGEIRLDDNPTGGSVVTLEFPLRTEQDTRSDREADGDASSPITMKSQAVAHGA
ncbi:MAG: PAS domain-containing sensor histidine kinase [Alphaproteobacteria bacterium]|nr:PAS domain-containing sensor histidine kinase [Alphaproteobacteria bacterium]